jgi:hypothetical protein
LFPAGAGLVVVSGASSSSGVNDDCVPLVDLVFVPDDGLGAVVVAGGFMVSAGVRSDVVGVVVFVIDVVLVVGAGSGPTILGVGDAVLAVVVEDVVVDGVSVLVLEVVVLVDGALALVLVVVVDDGAVVPVLVVLDEAAVVEGLVVGTAGGLRVGFIVPVDVLVEVGAGSGPADLADEVTLFAVEFVDSGVAVEAWVCTGVPSGGTGMGDGLIEVLSVGAGFTGGISLGTLVDSLVAATWV